MSAATSSSKFLPTIAAVVLALGLAGERAAAGQALPDTENGRYALSTTPDGVLRLDTRTGAVSTKSTSCPVRSSQYANVGPAIPAPLIAILTAAQRKI